MTLIRIAMWSGPRNISTAMMRAWENRPDTAVVDEPLYAHYLKTTGLDHPGREDVIRHHESDWRKVVADLTGPVPGGRAIYYQKHMSHHLLPNIDRGWLADLTHAFLIRDPREMLTSLIRNIPNPTLADTGLPQQLEIIDFVESHTGRTPPVVDARDILTDPPATLRKLCDALGVPFRDEMLHWPPGRRETDGAWAPDWYAAVEKSAGFEPYRPKTEPVPASLRPLLDGCLACYERLSALAIR